MKGLNKIVNNRKFYTQNRITPIEYMLIKI